MSWSAHLPIMPIVLPLAAGALMLLFDERRPPAAHPAHHEDEQVDGIGEQRQADDHLEGARPQQQPHPGAGERADEQRDDQFHGWRTD